MTPRKPGTFRAGDIVQLKSSTHLRKVHSVYWTEKGDVLRFFTSTFPSGPLLADKFELILPREERICGRCDLHVYGPEHLSSECQVR